MTLYICAVRDRQLGAFMRPFAAQSLGQAIRSFRDETNRNDSELNKHPEDYELFHLGNFNEDTGRLESLEAPNQLAVAKNLVERPA